MRVEFERSWPWVLAGVVAFSLAFNAARAEDSKAKTASGQLMTNPAGLKGGVKPIGKGNPATLVEDVRVRQAGQETQVRVEGNGNLSYALSRLSQPDRLVLDFSGVLVHIQQKLIPSNLRLFPVSGNGSAEQARPSYCLSLRFTPNPRDCAAHRRVNCGEESTRIEGSSPARAGETARQLIRRAKRASRRKFPAEEKIRIVLEGVRAEVSGAELCRREGIHPTIYYKWSEGLQSRCGKACATIAVASGLAPRRASSYDMIRAAST